MSLADELLAWLRKVDQPLIVVLGPTASGKTAYSVHLAHAFVEAGRGAEIVNADSRQLYRFLDIGTAKIMPEAMQGIPHHLLDVLDPKEEVTAAWYKERAVQSIDGILERGKLPMLVGGSMLYISAIIDNLEFVQEADPALRAQLSAAYDGDHGAALFVQLQERDPEAALGIDPRNKVYLLRALEISLLAQQALSAAKKKSASPYDLFVIGVQCPRAALHRRINERVRQMFDAGWVEEVRGLLKRGYTMNDPGLKSHGYREIASVLANGQLSSDRELQLIADISAKTRQYAKRQMTWWKHDPRIHWIVP